MGRPRATVCKRCGSERQAKDEALCRECHRQVKANRERKRKYKLTWDRFFEMMREQEEKCAICRRHFKPLGGPRVDHDHRTGKVRALLCNGCNVGLGQFCDDVGSLRSAIDYLLKFVSQSDEDKAETEGSKIEKSHDKATEEKG